MKKLKNYFLFLFFIFCIALLAFLGFKFWTELVLMNIFSIKNFSPLMYYSFAFIAGLISFFAPCAIGILPAYVAYYVKLKEVHSYTSKFKHAFHMGLMASLGIFVLYFSLGLILTIFGTTVASYFALSKPIIAGILIIIGLFLLFNYNIKNNYLYNLLRNLTNGREVNNLFFFGILYGAAALGCAMLVFVPLVVIPLTTGKFLTGLLAFIIYSFSFSLAMIVTTILIAYSKNVLIEKIAASSTKIKKITGVILILSAVYLIYYYVRYRM